MIEGQSANNDIQLRIRDLEAEVKRLEKDLQRTREKAQNSEKIKSIFLTNMSHAVRTPMNAIIGFSELIGMEAVSPEKKKEYIRIINEKGHQLLSLMDDFIEITKIDSGKIELQHTEFDIDEFLNEIFSATLQKKLTAGKDQVELVLERNSVEKERIIYTDSGRLQEIFNYILSFSIVNTSKGRIRFGYTITDPRFIEFFISDTGIGLSKEEQKIIFDYFWETEEITHRLAGNGLGLTIAKKLVELLGGKISVNSGVKEGTEFLFYLPVERPGKSSKSIPTQSESAPKEYQEYNWRNKVLLVVEDDAVNYQFIEALLERSQVQLLHAENGHQALQLCKTISKLDLILMDIKLPDKNGYQITKEIKAIRNDVPIVALTAFALSEVRDKCISSGCEDVMAKPVEIELFLATINKFLVG